MSDSLKRRLVIALSISALLNVFLIGFMTARAMFEPPRRKGPPPALFGGDPGRGPMRKVWKEHGDTLRPRRAAVREAQRQVRQALHAEPFEADALRQALSLLRTRSGEAQTELHGALVQLASELDLQGRKRLGRSMGRGRGGRRGHRPGGRGPHGPPSPAPVDPGPEGP